MSLTLGLLYVLRHLWIEHRMVFVAVCEALLLVVMLFIMTTA